MADTPLPLPRIATLLATLHWLPLSVIGELGYEYCYVTPYGVSRHIRLLKVLRHTNEGDDDIVGLAASHVNRLPVTAIGWRAMNRWRSWRQHVIDY